MKPLLKLFLISLILLVSLEQIIAQDLSNTLSKDQNTKYFELTSGFSPYSIRFLGKTEAGQTTYFNISRSKQIRELSDGALLYYRLGFVPYIHFKYPKRDDNGNVTTSHGFGFSPIGFNLNKNITTNFGYSVTTSGGIVYMNELFPTDKAKRLNYTFELSAAFYRNVSESIAFSLGYKFHHISNAQTGKQNPGLDSNFLYLSILFF